ncbi:MAG: 3-dehydroquinate synthase [Clostridiales bacterium]|nr:3-dehydroquinate synthase [Clostridiales bacterium]
MKAIRLSLGERSYDILTDAGILSRAGELLDLDRHVLVVTDSGVPAEYAKTVAEASRAPVVVTIPEGEGSKSFESYMRLLEEMLAAGFTRHDCVAAVGGGVCGDLAGFAAATYMRGIDFYNIPTTVLSQVDSSIGGKTAVDFHGYKNIVGAFWQPKRVLADPEVLETLPPRQIANGLAEAVKMAATSDAQLFRLFEEEDPRANLSEIIRRSLLIKKAVVEADEREGGLRRILNFGHTLGHAIEAAESPALLHGECVALGMLPMASEAARARIRAVLERLGLPTVTDGDPAKIEEALTHDKKSAAGGIDAVFVEEIGSCRVEKTPAAVLMERYRAVYGGTR